MRTYTARQETRGPNLAMATSGMLTHVRHHKHGLSFLPDTRRSTLLTLRCNRSPSQITILVQLLVENLVAGYRAWHVPSDAGLPNPAVVYSAVASTTSLVRNSAIVALAIVSDFIMVYRTFIVWASNYTIILVPVGLLLADIAFAVWSTWTLSQTGAGDDAITALVAVRVRYFFFVTFAVNLLCAALICWKIWRVHSNLPAELSSMRRSKSSTVRVFEVIVETAAIYCAHLLVLIISDSIGSNTFFVFLDPLPPVTALVFTVLIVRTRTPQVRPATSIMSAIQFVSQPEQSFVSNGT
ncbi:hypothetical protein C8Q80DRAFT_235306 [Daedaleopsis nitida]|nr:hypothetical protein C8Q80DRAFT_235306 [Daedaleopsis nitida]